MKKWFIILLSLVSAICFAVPEVSATGRWKINNDIEYSLEKSDKDFLIKFSRFEFIGNHIIEAQRGYLTFLQYEDGMPIQMRFYNHLGKEVWKKTFKNVINIKKSLNGRFFVFSDGDKLHKIDVRKNEFTYEEAALYFAVTSRGEVVTANKNSYSFQKETKTLRNIIDVHATKNDVFLITKDRIVKISKNKTNSFSLDEEIFDSVIDEKQLYITTRTKNKNSFNFKSYVLSKKLKEIKSWSYEVNKLRSHEEIRTPLEYGNDNYEAEIGNSYAEIQNYGEEANYLHPGVDFLGDDFEAVYAVKSGYVKAVLTTGGDPYWRIAISNEDTSDEAEGYLYAHLNYDSIPFNVGDFVEAGTQIGTLYPWGYYNFTHIHFARIRCSGVEWQGNWVTTDDPLSDMTNFVDTTSPIFENVIDSPIAFRNGSNIYLEANNLTGLVEVIVKAHDSANSTWKIDVRNFSYKLASVTTPEDYVLEENSFTYDFLLDVYTTEELSTLTMNTIYASDDYINSQGNYDVRDYYQIVTAFDGNPEVTTADANQRLNTSNFANGDYILTVLATDASGNTSSQSINITIANENQAPTFLNPPEFLVLDNQNPVVLDCYEMIQDDNTADENLLIIFDSSSNHLETSFNEESGILTLSTDYTGELYTLTIVAEDEEGLSSNQVIEVRPSTSVDNVASSNSTFKVFPNPYSKTHHRNEINLQFTTPVQTHLILELYDIKGRKISELANKSIPASRHTENINSTLIDSLSTGIYLIKAKAEKSEFSKKFIILK